MLQTVDVAHIGILCRADDSVCVVPPDLSPKMVTAIKKTLNVEVIPITICNTSLIGAMLILNSHGAVVTELAYDSEAKKLKEHLPLVTISDKLNAIGNNVLANDTHGLVHPQLSKETIEILESALMIEVAKGTVAGLKTVGSAGVVTNKGLLLHPETTEEELDFLKDFFKLPVYLGTVNFGFPYVGSAIVANSKGAIVGKNTTGIELGIIEEALGFV
ncbi:MAG: translation initiation factor IF-6 [Candidatus Thermoplasmatota archaeon]|nr:translation initiation factor IF-6 [Candidatus Thermoplasmatota archaeon]